jgi:hypothetical protein
MTIDIPLVDILALTDLLPPMGALLPGMASALALDQAAAGGVVPATIEFLGSDTTADNLSTYSFVSKTFGAAASDRYIAAVFGHSSNSSSRMVSSVSLGGVSATNVVEVSDTGSRTAYVCMAIAPVPTGTSGDLSITWNGALNDQFVFWYRITGIGGVSPFHTASNGVDPSAMSLNIPAGVVVVGGVCAGSGGSAFDWTNLTDDGDQGLDGSGRLGSGAHGAFASAQTGLAITADDTGSASGLIGGCASWGPAT